MESAIKKYGNKLLIASVLSAILLLIFTNRLVALLAMIILPLVSLIYLAVKMKDKDFIKRVKDKNYVRRTMKENFIVFTGILALAFGIGTILSLPLSGGSTFNPPLTVTFALLTILCIFIIAYSRKAKSPAADAGN